MIPTGSRNYRSTIIAIAMIRGVLADTVGTGGSVVNVSSGLTVGLANNLLAFGFLQLTTYSKLTGFQLFPRWTASVGEAYAF